MLLSVLCLLLSQINAETTSSLRSGTQGPEAMVQKTLNDIEKSFFTDRKSDIAQKVAAASKSTEKITNYLKPASLFDGLSEASEEDVAAGTETTGYIAGIYYKMVFSGTGAPCNPNATFQAVGFMIGQCFPTTLFADDDSPNYSSARIIKVTPPNWSKANPQFLLKIGLYTDPACTQNKVILKRKAPGSCVQGAYSSSTYGWLAAVPAGAPSGVFQRSYNTMADCYLGQNYYAVNYWMSGVCNNGNILSEDDASSEFPFVLSSCSMASIGTSFGSVVSVDSYSAYNHCQGSYDSTYFYVPTCSYNGGYVSALQCTGSGTHGTFTPNPTMSPVSMPTVVTSAAPTMMPTVAGAMNTGYVMLNSYANNTNCTGAAAVSSLALGFCYASPSGIGSMMYTNYLNSGSTSSVLFTQYSDSACQNVLNSQTVTYTVGQCIGNVAHKYSAYVPIYGPGVMVTGYSNFQSCSLGMNPMLYQFIPVNACVGSSVINACTPSKISYTSFAYADCSTQESMMNFYTGTCFDYNGMYYSLGCSGGVMV